MIYFKWRWFLVRTCTLAFTFLDSYSKGKHWQVALSDQNWGEDKTWTPGPWTPSLDRVHGPPSWTRSMDPLHGPGPWTPFFLLFFCFISCFLFSSICLFYFFLTKKKKRKLEEKRNKIKAHKAKSHGPLIFFIFCFLFFLFSFFLTKKNRKNNKK